MEQHMKLNQNSCEFPTSANMFPQYLAENCHHINNHQINFTTISIF